MAVMVTCPVSRLKQNAVTFERSKNTLFASRSEGIVESLRSLALARLKKLSRSVTGLPIVFFGDFFEV